MTALDGWLKKATRHLSDDSVVRVRIEIQEHYESARATAMNSGATADEADGLAVAALGNANVANREYRKVLLTSTEARMLRDGNWEARAICSISWLKWLLATTPVAALLTAAISFLTGAVDLARVLLLGGIGMGFLFLAPFLPVYTPSRGCVFRSVKWVALIGTLVVVLGPDVLKWFWLVISCLWPLVWIEWTRASIRRKLRVAEWPKQLYL
jgi:hypothetical protein